MARAEQTDMGTGFGVLFGVLTLLASIVLFYAGGLVGAYGFGAALILGSLLVIALHVYE
ncbi:MAG: hypothetical protein ABEI31_04490 [Halodesulfurarchaeum sp.]